MNKKELFECLSGLSQTNNSRDGIDIRKEEANIIVNEIERLNNIIEEVREYLNKNEIEEVYLDCKLYETKVYKDILEILDKGSDEISK